MDKLTLNKALQRGIEVHKAGQFREADRQYSAILRVEPKHPEANHSMGMLAVDVGKFEEALAFFKTALETDPNVVQFWLSYIDLLIKLNYLTDARTVFDQAKNKGVKGNNFDMLEQRLNEATGELIKTVTVDNKTEHVQPNILDSLKLNQALKLAKKKIKDGFRQEAKQIYRDILSQFPKNQRAIDGLKVLSSESDGKVSRVQDPPQDQIKSIVNLYSQGQFQQALQHSESLLREFPNSATLFNMQGTALKSLGQINLAIEAYAKALTIKPDFASANYNIGNALKDLGKSKEATEAYKKAVITQPDHADAYYNMGITLKAQGKLDEAIHAYSKALTIKPDYAEACNNMGIALNDLGKLEEAMNAFKKALTIKPERIDFLENLQSLMVQLFPIIDNDHHELNISDVSKGHEFLRRPKYHIQRAIKAYLSKDFERVRAHINNFNACDQKLLGMLSPHDKVFCNAYNIFIGELLDRRWREETSTENKVYHLGESHCLSYAHCNIKISGSNFKITPRITFGAKAFHFSLARRNIFKAITRAHFASIPKYSKVFLSFGEIDCRPDEGFLYAGKKLATPLEELIDQTTEGYVQWFVKENVLHCHTIYFVNVPAPVYRDGLSSEINSAMARTVAMFNAALRKYTLQHGIAIVDVFKFTTDKNGFSNGKYHVDNYHLGPKAILEIERQFT